MKKSTITKGAKKHATRKATTKRASKAKTTRKANAKQKTKQVKVRKARSSGFSLYGNQSKVMKVAMLRNCRGYDVKVEKGSVIKEGSIVKGKWGYSIAECDIQDACAEIVKFKKTGEFKVMENTTIEGKLVKAGTKVEVMHMTSDHPKNEGVNTYAIARIQIGRAKKCIRAEFARWHAFYGQVKLAIA